jgi:hypothetical protein
MSEEAKTVSEIASLGGKAAAAKMTREERSVRAKQAAAARWTAKLPRATHGDSNHPLKIGSIEIPCYVLEDGRRVISQRGFQAALGMNASGGARRLLDFVGHLAVNGIDCKGLESRVSEPIQFMSTRDSGGASVAHGYEASALADMCDVILEARKAGLLRSRQLHYADYCEILLRGFARVGIVALIDEVTGFQEARERDALAKILEAFIAKELQPYIRTFEADYYKAICRLRGWEYKTSSRRPRALAQITNDIVYSRLAPGVLDELRRKNPIVKKGQRGSKHFQWLTDQKGHPELQKHLARITGWMEMSETWDEFYKVLNERKPPYRGLTLFDVHGEDDKPDDTPTSSSTEPQPPSSRSLPAVPE